MVYIWPCSDDGRRCLVLYRELDTITTNQLHTACQAEGKKTAKEWFPMTAKKKTKDSMKGLGIGYDDEVLRFDKIRKKVKSNQLYGD